MISGDGEDRAPTGTPVVYSLKNPPARFIPRLDPSTQLRPTQRGNRGAASSTTPEMTRRRKVRQPAASSPNPTSPSNLVASSSSQNAESATGLTSASASDPVTNQAVPESSPVEQERSQSLNDTPSQSTSQNSHAPIPDVTVAEEKIQENTDDFVLEMLKDSQKAVQEGCDEEKYVQEEERTVMTDVTTAEVEGNDFCNSDKSNSKESKNVEVALDIAKDGDLSAEEGSHQVVDDSTMADQDAVTASQISSSTPTFVDSTQHIDPLLLDPALLDPALLDPALLDPALLDPALLDPALLDPALLDLSLLANSPPGAALVATPAPEQRENTAPVYLYDQTAACPSTEPAAAIDQAQMMDFDLEIDDLPVPEITEEEIKFMEEELESWQAGVNAAANESDSVKTEMDNVKTELDSVKAELESVKAENQSLKDNIQHLGLEGSNAIKEEKQRSMDERNRLKSHYKRRREEVVRAGQSQLDDLRQKLQTEKDHREAERQAAESIEAKLQHEYMVAESDVETAQQSCHEIQLRLDNMQTWHQNLNINETSHQRIAQHAHEMLGYNQMLERTVAELNFQQKELNRQIEYYQQTHAHNPSDIEKNLRWQLEAKTSEVEHLIRKSNEATFSNGQVLAALQDAGQENERLKSNIQILEMEKTGLEAKNMETETQKTELGAMNSELKFAFERLELKAQALEREKKGLEAKNMETETQKTKLGVMNSELDFAIKTFEWKVQVLEVEKKKIQVEKNSLETHSKLLMSENKKLKEVPTPKPAVASAIPQTSAIDSAQDVGEKSESLLDESSKVRDLEAQLERCQLELEAEKTSSREQEASHADKLNELAYIFEEKWETRRLLSAAIQQTQTEDQYGPGEESVLEYIPKSAELMCFYKRENRILTNDLENARAKLKKASYAYQARQKAKSMQAEANDYTKTLDEAERAQGSQPQQTGRLNRGVERAMEVRPDEASIPRRRVNTPRSVPEHMQRAVNTQHESSSSSRASYLDPSLQDEAPAPVYAKNKGKRVAWNEEHLATVASVPSGKYRRSHEEPKAKPARRQAAVAKTGHATAPGWNHTNKTAFSFIYGDGSDEDDAIPKMVSEFDLPGPPGTTDWGVETDGPMGWKGKIFGGVVSLLCVAGLCYA